MDHPSTLTLGNGEYAIMRKKKNLFQRPDIITEIIKRLMWAGHAWKKEGSLIRTVTKLP